MLTITPRRIAASAAAAALSLAAPMLLAPQATSAPAADGTNSQRHHAKPIVIGHRGASGYRPEHTLAAYRLAIRLGADYVEPDLVSTKDGVLVARHENEISGTTNVADHPEFAGRKKEKTIDGVKVTGWWTEDFTLRELKTLRAKERLPLVRPDNTRYDGQFEVPTFQEVIDLVKRESKRTGRKIGIYPETKHPTYFDSIGLSLEEPLLRTLKRNGLDSRRDRVFIQSFETGNLRELARKTKLQIVQLINNGGAPYDLVAAGDPRTYKDLITPAGLRWIAGYADGIGANKDLVLPRDPATGATGQPSTLVRDAHGKDLIVHVWTIRDENQFMATNFRVGTNPNAKGNAAAEVRAFFNAGVDGMFADHPDTAVEARRGWLDD